MIFQNTNKKKEENSLQQNVDLYKLIPNPSTLQLLTITGKNIQKFDFKILNICTMLIKLDISCNNIQNLSPGLAVQFLKNLKIIYLHENLIDNINPLASIIKQQNLQYLTIYKNPISNKMGIRHYLVNQLPQLLALDQNLIADSERSKFLNFNENQDTKLDWPILPSSINTFTIYQQIIQEINFIRRKYEKNSSIIIIQSHLRGYLIRSKLNSKFKRKIISIREQQIALFVIDRWRKYINKRKIIKEVMLKKQILVKGKYMINKQKGLKIKEHLILYQQNVFYKNLSDISSKKIQRSFLKICSIFKDYINKLNFNQNPSFYFEIEYNETFNYILEQCLARLKKVQHNSLNINYVQDIIDNQQKYIIKSPDVICLRIQYNKEKCYSRFPILQFTRPSLLSSFIIKKPNEQVNKLQDIWYIQQFKLKIQIKEKRIFLQKGFTAQEKQKIQQVQNKLMKFKQIHYMKLQYFKCENLAIFKEITKQIIIYNKQMETRDKLESPRRDIQTQTQEINKATIKENYKKNQLFFIFLPEKIQLISKVVIIQTFWRKKQFKSNIFNLILRKRAVIFIQNWLRNLKYFIKKRFFKKIEIQLTQIRSPSLYLQEKIYFSLQKILEMNIDKAKIQEQDHQIKFNSFQKICRLIWDLKKPIYKKLFPDTLQQLKYGSQYGDLMHLLHLGSQVSMVHTQSVNYLKFDFSCIEEAQYRYFAIALITFRIIYGGTFVKLLSTLMFDDKFHLELYYQKIKHLYNISLEGENPPNDVQGKIINNEQALFIQMDNQLNITKSIYNFNLSMEIFFSVNPNAKPIRINQDLYIFYSDNIYLQKPTKKDSTQKLPIYTTKTSNKITFQSIDGENLIDKSKKITQRSKTQTTEASLDFEEENIVSYNRKISNAQQQQPILNINVKREIVLKAQKLQDQLKQIRNCDHAMNLSAKKALHYQQQYKQKLHQSQMNDELYYQKIKKVVMIKTYERDSKLKETKFNVDSQFNFITKQKLIQQNNQDKYHQKIDQIKRVQQAKQSVSTQQSQNQSPYSRRKISLQDNQYCLPQIDNTATSVSEKKFLQIEIKNRIPKNEQKKDSNKKLFKRSFINEKYHHSVFAEELYPILNQNEHIKL